MNVDGCCSMNVVANCSCSGGGRRLVNAEFLANKFASSDVHGYHTGILKQVKTQGEA